jgi:methylene-tetrahydromethanopterin dehydrogenase
MEKPYVLHMFTPMPQVSPFDVNMAYDAGYNAVVPYTGLTLDQVTALTQDAIFSRGPKGAKRTGIFIGGRDNGLAADMLDAARRAMVPPFAVSVFADPSGAFTTAAAMLAAVEKHLRKRHSTNLERRRVLVFGGTGPVGAAVAVLASQAGARTAMVARQDIERTRRVADDFNARYGTRIEAVPAQDEKLKAAMMHDAEVVLATARAGQRVVSKALLDAGPALLVAADVNAVPPSGVEGIGAMDDGTPLAAKSGKAVGIGALAIGNIKYQAQRGLFEAMLKADAPLYLDLRDALNEARRHAGAA